MPAATLRQPPAQPSRTRPVCSLARSVRSTLRPACYCQKVRTENRLVLLPARHGQEDLQAAIIQALGNIGRHPPRPLDPQCGDMGQPRLNQLGFQLGREVEKGGGEHAPPREPAVLPVGQLPRHHGQVGRVPGPAAEQPKQGGGIPADGDGEQQPTRPQDSPSLPQGGQAVVPFGQVIERAVQQERVGPLSARSSLQASPTRALATGAERKVSAACSACSMWRGTASIK